MSTLVNGLKMTKKLFQKLFAHMSFGNMKLVSSAFTMFLIWSLPAMITCPFATGLCKKSCYARKAERNYPDCLPSRKRNFEFTKSPLFVPVMIAYICYVAGLKAYRTAKHITVRIHESGDFYSKAYMLKWYKIAKACSHIANIDFGAYTKSVKYVSELYNEGYTDIVDVLGLRYSIWSDTKISDIALASKLSMPVYTAYKAEDGLPEGYAKCDCADCGHCRKCYNGDTKEQYVACEIH